MKPWTILWVGAITGGILSLVASSPSPIPVTFKGSPDDLPMLDALVKAGGVVATPTGFPSPHSSDAAGKSLSLYVGTFEGKAVRQFMRWQIEVDRNRIFATEVLPGGD